MVNTIPLEWRTDGLREVSPIGCMISETPLEQLECPRCGKPHLVNRETGRDGGDFPIYQVVCSTCDWCAPDSTQSTDVGDALFMFKEWLEAFYINGCLDTEADLAFDYREFFDDPMTEKQQAAIRSRTIPHKYVITTSGKREISPLGRIIEKVHVSGMRCPSCKCVGSLYMQDRSDALQSPLPRCQVACRFCNWRLPSGISKSPECAEAEFHNWMEAWCLLGCQSDMVNADVTELFPREYGNEVFDSKVEADAAVLGVRAGSKVLALYPEQNCSATMEVSFCRLYTGHVTICGKEVGSSKVLYFNTKDIGKTVILCGKDPFMERVKRDVHELRLEPGVLQSQPAQLRCLASDLRQRKLVADLFRVNVGDTVYLPERDDLGGIICYDVIKVGFNKFGAFFVVDDEDQEELPIDDIGKDVFLTEAEAAAHCAAQKE